MIKAISSISFNNRNKTEHPVINAPLFHRQLYFKPDSFELSFKATTVLKKNMFSSERMDENNPKWENSIKREVFLPTRPNDIRNAFERDCDRIINTEGFDRLRLKSQVFVHPDNDMLSTRSTHVNLVANISRRLASYMGLNVELAEAIATGHDLGHAPFGHEGEHALNKIAKKYNLEPFWHEKNSLKMIDKILTLSDNKGKINNLNLTYAIRDGIVCHCGEVDQNGIKPRDEFINLNNITKSAHPNAYTWEGCLVKAADKIAYIGRDIQDALLVGILEEKHKKELKDIVKKHIPDFNLDVNNGTLINLFSNDLMKNSNPTEGIRFSPEVFELMKELKAFNYKNIYLAPKTKPKEEYFIKILGTIFEDYDKLYQGENTLNIIKQQKKGYHYGIFCDWLEKYSKIKNRDAQLANEALYDLKDRQQYRQAIVDFISGMTDKYAIKTFDDIQKSLILQ